MEDEFDIENLYPELDPATLSNPDNVSSIIQYNSKLGESQYDDGFLAHLHQDEGDIDTALNSYRASKQSGWDQLGNSLGRLTNIIPEAIGGIASAFDFEDYFNSNQEVGNWLTTMMDEWKETTTEALPIYRENPGKSLDFGDSGWWFENGSSLVNSIGGFAISGGVITKGLGGLSKLSRVDKLAKMIGGVNKANKVGQVAQTATTATMLNQAESIMEATQVFDSTYKFEFDKLSAANDPDAESKAKQKAADAAKLTINANRANIILNLSSANLFLKAPKLTSNILKKETFRSNLTRGGVEGVQESAEEVINLIAGDIGRAFGEDKDYSLSAVLNNLNAAEATEAALLGFIGGMGQTVITKEGVNRLNKTIDPDTGEKISVRDYNKKQYDQQQEIIQEYDDNAKENNIKTFTNAFDSIKDNLILQKAYKKAIKNEDNEEAQRLANLTLGVQSFHAFKNGTTENLIKLYEELKKGPQKEGMGEDYKEKASAAISNIKKLEKYYNFSQEFANNKEVYLNRNIDVELTNELNNYNNLLTEKEGDLNSKIEHKLKYKRYAKLNFHPQDRPKISPTPVTASDLDTETENVLKNKFKSTIKKLPEYKAYVDTQNKIDDILSKIDKNDNDFNKITSDKYQTSYKKKIESIDKAIKNSIDKQQAKVEKEIKTEEAEAIKEEEKAVRAEKVTTQAVDAETENITNDVHKAVSNLKPYDIFTIPESLSATHAGKQFYLDGSSSTDDIKVLKDTNTGSNIIIEVPTYKKTQANNYDIDDYATSEGGDINRVVTNNENTLDTNPDKIGNGSKLISTDNKGKAFDFIKKDYAAYLDYEKEPIDKIGTIVKFSLNTNDLKNPKWTKATALYKKGINTLNDTEIEYLIDYLPIDAVLTDKIKAPIETIPTTEQDPVRYINSSRILRKNIINELMNGKSLNELNTTIEGQYEGVLKVDEKVDGKVLENSIMDLHFLKGKSKADKIKTIKENIGVVNDNGDITFVNGAKVPMKVSSKGEFYLRMPMANGKPFYLKLNSKKISIDHASLLHDLYSVRINDTDLTKSTRINELEPSLASKINNVLKDEVNLIGTKGDLTIKDVIDFLVWDGAKSIKSRIKLEGTGTEGGRQFIYGNPGLNGAIVNKGEVINKENFTNWLTSDKRYSISFKPKKGQQSKASISINDKYLEYLLDNKILNTNAVVGENNPTFQGFTTIYLNSNGIEKSKVSPKFDSKVDGDSDDLVSRIVGSNTYLASIKSGRLFSVNKNIESLHTRIMSNAELVSSVVKDNKIIDQFEKENNADDSFDLFQDRVLVSLTRYSAPTPNLKEKLEIKEVQKKKEKIIPKDEVNVSDRLIQDLTIHLATAGLLRLDKQFEKTSKKGNKALFEYLKNIADSNKEDIAAIIKKCQ